MNGNFLSSHASQPETRTPIFVAFGVAQKKTETKQHFFQPVATQKGLRGSMLLPSGTDSFLDLTLAGFDPLSPMRFRWW